jgi:hypothetical protein
MTRPPQTLPIPKALLYPTPIPMPSPRHLTRRQVGQHHPRLPPPARPYRQHRTLQSVDPDYPTPPFPTRVRTRNQVLQRLPLCAAGYQHPPVAVRLHHRMCPQLPNRFKPLRRIQAPIGQPQHPPIRRKGRGKGTPPLRPDRVPRWLVPRHRDGALFVKHTEAACALDAEAPGGLRCVVATG